MDQATILATLQLKVQESRADELQHPIPDGTPAPRYDLGDTVRLTGEYASWATPHGARITRREYVEGTGWWYMTFAVPPTPHWNTGLLVPEERLTPYTTTYSAL